MHDVLRKDKGIETLTLIDRIFVVRLQLIKRNDLEKYSNNSDPTVVSVVYTGCIHIAVAGRRVTISPFIIEFAHLHYEYIVNTPIMTKHQFYFP